MHLYFKTTVQKYAFMMRQTRGFPEKVIGETLIYQREGHIHHMREGGLPLFSRRNLSRQDMVGNRTDAQGAIAGTGRIHIEGCNLHLYSQDSHVDPLVIMSILVIEDI